MSTPTPSLETARDPRRWLVLAVMSIGTLIVFLDGTVVNTALPNISTKLGATTSQLQWVVDSYILVLAGLLLLGGTIGDRFGRRRWMNIGLLFFMGGSVLGGLSDSIATLIAARAVQGLGAALVLPATLSIVTNVFDREERAKAIAIWTAVGGLGVGLGPAVGGYLVEHWDYTAAFWIHVPILALAGVGMLFVAESRDPRPVGLDVPGALTATIAVSSLVYGIIQGGEMGWTATRSSSHSASPLHRSSPSSPSSAAPLTRCCHCASSVSATSPAASWHSASCSSPASSCSSSSASTGSWCRAAARSRLA